MDINTALEKIQRELKAPKNQYNSFGKYKYRSCEDIVEGVKKVMPEGCSLLMSDKIIEVGGRVYVEATATLRIGSEGICATASAREPEDKKGMDASQITGTASSYARKYALNGLFCIDDTKDSDTGIHEDSKSAPLKAKVTEKVDKKLTPEQQKVADWITSIKAKIKACEAPEDITFVIHQNVEEMGKVCNEAQEKHINDYATKCKKELEKS